MLHYRTWLVGNGDAAGGKFLVVFFFSVFSSFFGLFLVSFGFFSHLKGVSKCGLVCSQFKNSLPPELVFLAFFLVLTVTLLLLDNALVLFFST